TSAVEIAISTWTGSGWSYVGNFSALKIENYIAGWKEVIRIKGQGSIQLKPSLNDWGSSFLLTGYWRDGTPDVYYDSLKIKKLCIRTDTDYSLLLTSGTAYDNPSDYYVFTDSLTIRCYPTTQQQVKSHVSYRLKANQNFNIDSTKLTNTEGFKIAQFSSMYLHSITHSADKAEYLSSTGTWRIQAFPDATGSNWIYVPTMSMGYHYLYCYHSDAQPKNTPTCAIRIDKPYYGQFTPRGWITASSNSSVDNLKLWLHWDNVANSYSAGNTIGDFDYYLFSLPAGRRMDNFNWKIQGPAPISATKQ
ncbi:MAG: hypothetical protein QME68_05655, partial [Elusimicrobiota bacterium]|nr:hypothetical protein [Elusimicrobiota bacterium]